MAIEELPMLMLLLNRGQFVLPLGILDPVAFERRWLSVMLGLIRERELLLSQSLAVDRVK
jgi:hypothetical protein